MELPKKNIAAGALILSTDNKLLIVKPNYKKCWHIPGGVVEKYESPFNACLREVKEETDLAVKIVKLASICHYTKENDERDSLIFIFDCGFIDNEDIESIKLQESEIEGYKFIDIFECNEYLEPVIAKMILSYFETNKCNTVFFNKIDQVI